MHKLLERQIRRHLDSGEPIPPGFQALLEVISAAYEQSEADRALLERSLELNSKELLERNRQLLNASLAKSAFLANMSHEIRTPMTAIIGYADMVLDSQQSEAERRDCLWVIQRNAKHLSALIDDILDISKIEAEKMTVEKIPFDLSQLIFDVAATMKFRAGEKNLNFRCQSSGPVPKQVTTDPVRLKQVLVNVLGNAIKFTQQGDITLTVVCTPRPDGSTLRLEVKDSGIGMSPDQIARLFQPFTQADGSMTRRFGGTGLGLAISKRLSHLLGGDIFVQSAPGAGSTFTIQIEGGLLDGVPMLPKLEEPSAEETAQPPAKMEIRLNGRVLLAEDGIDNQRLVAAYLRRAGAEFVAVENGKLALDRALQEPFDVILMDMQMPEMDGYTATSELRRMGYQRPIVALTAHAMADDRAKCLDAGCSEYLTKPIDRQMLIATLAGYMPHSLVEPQTASPANGAAGAGSAAPGVPQDYMKKLTEGFITALPQRVAHLLYLLDQRNLDELKRAIHRLKGSGGGYGFPVVSQCASAAEETLEGEQQLDKIADQVQSLVSLLRSIEGYRPEREILADAAPIPGAK
jgi:signal transduction histidine kinase/CheY-like chemotaxis protein/HPt (histidine-containing phosphotransfer) domain-containing protein